MGIEFSFSSCGYWDVSVPRVCRRPAMYSLTSNTLMCTGFPHSEISGSKITYISPKHIVVSHVLHQLLMPRHPPYALTNLITIKIIILIWLRFYNKNLNRLIATTIRLPHYQVFKELLWESYSLKTKQNIQVASFSVFLFLHRKEVIHPHVLVGIPCYDFTPITCPTLNGPLLKG